MTSLSVLPTELQLRIIYFLDTQSLLRLTSASRHWHKLIDDASQDADIYQSRTIHPVGAKDISFLKDETTCFTHYYTNRDYVNSWKDLCRCQTLLDTNWRRAVPVTRDSLIVARRSNAPLAYIGPIMIMDPAVIPIWRFRPDFKRRFVLCTTQHGGLVCMDMDSGALLWSLGQGEVRSYAHLEYSNGWCAFDRFGNAIEIWKHIGDRGDETGSKRGTFERVTILRHDVQTRGFQMLWPTLCVVSTEERGFVYDLSADGGPKLTREMQIASGTVGHIEQSPEDTVMYCLGKAGYDFHSKSTGRHQGTLDPKSFYNRPVFHIQHNRRDALTQSVLSKQEPIPVPFPPRRPQFRHIPTPFNIELGTRVTCDGSLSTLEDDEWGAGLIRGDLMVGISKGGRCMICLDWPGAIRSASRAADCTFLIELEIDTETYDFGGWLGVQRGPPGPTRIIFEVDDKVYMLRMDNDMSEVLDGTRDFTEAVNCLSIPSGCTPDLGVPISFMGVYDDCIMHTALVGIKRREGDSRNPYIAKAIHVLSFAPTCGEPSEDASPGEESDEWLELNTSHFDHH